MMSDYFSDWDKSYYVTTVTGGSGKGSIQTVVSDIGLKKNGKYELKIASAAENIKDIPYFVKNKATGKVFLEGTLDASGEVLEEFTSPEDADCEIVFLIGGADSSRFTLKELKLTRLA